MIDFRNFWSPVEKTLYKKITEYPVDRSMADHMTASAFVVNPSCQKVLFIYHKKYDSWSWIGGHWDSGETILETAVRELEEESGIVSQPISSYPISVEKLLAGDHYHFNATFLFVVEERTPLHLNESETNGIRWFPILSIPQVVTEKHMLPVYDQIVTRIQKKKF